MRRPSAPTVLLIALAIACVVTIGYAAATSQTAFGPYTTTWEGTSELRGMADEGDRSLTVARNTSTYDHIAANDTIALVLAPDETYDGRAATRVRDFLARGGTLLVAEAARPHANELLAEVGASTRVDGAPLRDETNHGPSPDFPEVTPNATDPLTAGVETVLLNHGSALNATNGTVLLASSPYGYLDRNLDDTLNANETLDTYPVAAREPVANGSVVVISDPSVFINAMLERADNRAFLRNVLSDHERIVFDVSHRAGLPPLALALLVLRESMRLQAAIAGTALIAIWVGFRTDWLGRARARLGDRPADGIAIGYSPEDLRRHLEQRHPDWSEERIDRIVAAIEERDTSPYASRDSEPRQ